MHHVIAAACQAQSCTGNWQYATESWSTGGVILGAVILVLVLAAAGAARRIAR
jgi:hypothetical protein